MPRAREDGSCGLYCPKLLAIALITRAKFFCWIEVRKLCHDVRWEMENPSVPCTQCSCCSLWSPTSARACSWCPRGHQGHCLLRAASLLARGPYQAWDLACQQECSSILQQLLLILHLLFARLREVNTWRGMEEKHQPLQLTATSPPHKVNSKSMSKVKSNCLPGIKDASKAYLKLYMFGWEEHWLLCSAGLFKLNGLAIPLQCA